MNFPFRCLSFLFCDILWCQCNCIIFPSPSPSYTMEGHEITMRTVSIKIKKCELESAIIPYIQISTEKSRQSAKCIIYFHGNAQDIGLSTHFLTPIVEQLNITIYSLQYPTYGCYQTCFKAMISNKIKENALLFYQFIRSHGKTKDDIYVFGRSIGSGGASYLAGRKSIPKLILMSPFDTIKQVAKQLVGCMGCIVKQHFNNQEEIIKHDGHLLLIHGESDQVINVSHGKNLMRIYESQNPYRNKCQAIFPRRMSHNRFDMKLDIVNPIKKFINLSDQQSI